MHFSHRDSKEIKEELTERTSQINRLSEIKNNLLREAIDETPEVVHQSRLKRCIASVDLTSRSVKNDLICERKLIGIIIWLTRLARRVDRSLEGTPVIEAVNEVIRLGDPQCDANDYQSKVSLDVAAHPSQRDRIIERLWTFHRKAAVSLSFAASLPTEHPLRSKGFSIIKLARAVVALDETYIENRYRATKRLEGSVWRLETLHEFHWQTVEDLVAALLVELGYSVQRTVDRGDFGVDVWANIDNRLIACEVKHRPSKDSVGRPVVQKLVSHLATGTATGVLLITTGPITRPAKRYAATIDEPVKLVDGNQLIKLLSMSSIPEPLVP